MIDYNYTIEDAAWQKAVKLIDETSIDLTGIDKEDRLFINTGVSEIVATLDYTEATEAGTDEDGSEIPASDAKYTLAKGEDGTIADGAKVAFGTGILDVDGFKAEVTTTGDATINGVAFDAVEAAEGEEGGLTIAADDSAEIKATLTAGTVLVADSLNTTDGKQD